MIVWIVRRYDDNLIDAIFNDKKEAYYLFGDSDEWYISEWDTHKPIPDVYTPNFSKLRRVNGS